MRLFAALEEYFKAVLELAEALGSEPSTRLEKAGCIQYFEFCFELAWKALGARLDAASRD
jgi:hypothetical protein